MTKLKSIYFQTKEMVRTFRAYTELLLINATYTLNDLQKPLYVPMVVDGNGESEIICFWLTQCEDKVTLGSFSRSLKSTMKIGSLSIVSCLKKTFEKGRV